MIPFLPYGSCSKPPIKGRLEVITALIVVIFLLVLSLGVRDFRIEFYVALIILLQF